MTAIRFSAAAERNQEPILTVLQRVFPRTGLVLEIASGTGQHVVHFAAALPELTWQPSDADADAHASIRAYLAASGGLANVRAPIELDVCQLPWPVARADALLCINMIHIAPWAATEALFTGAGAVLAQGAVLLLYGPYRRFGRHTAPSNEVFDAQLRARDPAWGVRDLEVVLELAVEHGLELAELVEMPANNLSVVLHRRR